MTTIPHGASASTFDTPKDVYSDGTRLFLVDYNDSRVLIWNTIPTANEAPASVVIGQGSMSGSLSGTSASQLDFPEGVYGDGTRSSRRGYRQ